MNSRSEGTGAVVLLLHGIPTSGQLWHYVLKVLRQRFRCITVDLPGMGESPPFSEGSRDPDRYALALEEFRLESGIDSWHIIGHDAGSTIAVHYAAKFGAHLGNLVLCSPPLFPDLRLPRVFRLLRIPIIGDCVAPLANLAVWRIGIPSAIGRHDQTATGIIEAFRQPFRGYRGARRFVQLLRWGNPAAVLARTAALLPQIAVPTLILHGIDDGTIPCEMAARAATLIPKAKIQFLDSGHFLPLSCPDILCHHLLPFLGEKSASA